MLFLITVFVLTATAVALCACGEEENDGTMFTVTLKSGYNDDSTSVQVAYGANYALPENPFTRSGYDFTGWKNLAGETVFGADGKSNALIAEGVAKG